MAIQDYNELGSLELDTLKEIGSIGAGNAATALSDLVGKQIWIKEPEVRIMGYNETMEWIGGPEVISAGVLVKLGGQINGIMLAIQQLDFVNLLLESMLGQGVEDYFGLHEMETSALVEVGNILISTFINAISSLADVNIQLTVPAFTVDMQGAIMAVPMATYGGQSDYLMTIGGHFVCEGKEIPCRLLLSPDIRSLNVLLRKLGVDSGE